MNHTEMLGAVSRERDLKEAISLNGFDIGRGRRAISENRAIAERITRARRALAAKLLYSIYSEVSKLTDHGIKS